MEKKKILILDIDDPSIASHLEKVGYEVFTTSTKRIDCLIYSKFAQFLNRFQVVIFDPFWMREGLEEIKGFKEEYPAMKLVALSSLCLDNIRTAMIDNMVQAGVLLYLQKPVSLEDILKTVAA